MSNYNKIICDIHKKWLTLKFLEIPRQLLANSLGDFVNESDVEEYRDIPKEPQDEGVPAHNDNLGASPIYCVIGHVKMGKWWGMVDRSIRPLQINICDIQEPEYKSEDNFSISCGM